MSIGASGPTRSAWHHLNHLQECANSQVSTFLLHVKALQRMGELIFPLRLVSCVCETAL